MNSKNMAKNSILNVIRTLVVNVIPLITYMYGARIFLADGNGKIWFSNSYTSYFIMLGMLGIEKYGIREIAKIRDNREKVSFLAQEILLLNLCAVLVSLLIFGITLFNIPGLIQYRPFLMVFGAGIILTPMGLNWLYMAEEDYQYITIKSCIVSLASIIALLLFVHEKEDILLFVGIQVISTTGSNLFNLIHSRKYVDYSLKHKYYPFRHLKPVLVLFCMTFFIEVFTHLDTTMVGFIAGDVATGLYSSAHKISGTVTAVITAAVMVIMPRMSLFAKQKDFENINLLSKRIVNMILMLGIPSALGIIMLSSPLNRIFSGAEFEGAALTSRILSLRVILASLNGFMVMYLFIPLEKERWNLVSTGMAAVLNLIFNSVFIPFLQQNGAALGTILAEGVELAINLYFMKKVVPLLPLFKDLWQYIVAAAPIIIIALIMSGFIQNAFLLVMLCTISSALVYFILLWLLKNQFIHDIINEVK